MVAITLSSARVITPSAISSILQEILSPTNTDRAMQLINIGAAKPNYVTPEIARPCDELPARFAYLPAREPVRVASDYARTVAPGTTKLRQVPVREVQRVYQPNSMAAQEPIFQTFLGEEGVRPCSVSPAFNPYLPVASPVSPAFNPYLPVASPVSAMSPGTLPPPTQSRGQFLRKIPISPPTI